MEEQKENDGSKEESSAVYNYIILGIISCFWWYYTPEIVGDAIFESFYYALKVNELLVLIMLPVLVFLLPNALYFGIGIGIDRMFKKSKSSQNTYYIVLTMCLVFTAILYVYYICEGLKNGRY